MVENYISAQVFNITLNYFILVIMLQMNSDELGFYMHTKTARRDSCSHYISYLYVCGLLMGRKRVNLEGHFYYFINNVSNGLKNKNISCGLT